MVADQERSIKNAALKTKNMKKFIIFVLSLSGAILVKGLYIQYCVSRPLNAFLQILATIFVLIIDAGVFIYAVKQLINLLKL